MIAKRGVSRIHNVNDSNSISHLVPGEYIDEHLLWLVCRKVPWLKPLSLRYRGILLVGATGRSVERSILDISPLYQTHHRPTSQPWQKSWWARHGTGPPWAMWWNKVWEHIWTMRVFPTYLEQYDNQRDCGHLASITDGYNIIKYAYLSCVLLLQASQKHR